MTQTSTLPSQGTYSNAGRANTVPIWVAILIALVGSGGLIGVLYTAWMTWKGSSLSTILTRMTAIETTSSARITAVETERTAFENEMRRQYNDVQNQHLQSRHELITAQNSLLVAQRENERLIRDNEELTADKITLERHLTRMQIELTDLRLKYEMMNRTQQLYLAPAETIIGVPVQTPLSTSDRDY